MGQKVVPQGGDSATMTNLACIMSDLRLPLILTESETKRIIHKCYFLFTRHNVQFQILPQLVAWKRQYQQIWLAETIIKVISFPCHPFKSNEFTCADVKEPTIGHRWNKKSVHSSNISKLGSFPFVSATLTLLPFSNTSMLQFHKQTAWTIFHFLRQSDKYYKCLFLRSINWLVIYYLISTIFISCCLAHNPCLHSFLSKTLPYIKLCKWWQNVWRKCLIETPLANTTSIDLQLQKIIWYPIFIHYYWI